MVSKPNDKCGMVTWRMRSMSSAALCIKDKVCFVDCHAVHSRQV